MHAQLGIGEVVEDHERRIRNRINDKTQRRMRTLDGWGVG